MIEIEFSVLEDVAGTAEQLRPLLQAFEQQHQIHVRLLVIPWATGWTEIAKFGFYGHGPDVSEVGTTWIGSLAAMQALRPFTEAEVLAVGGEEAFFENAWRSGFLPDDPSPWAIPWLGDVLTLHYWKDTLKKAKIKDEADVFSSYDALIETLKKLQKSGIPYPLTLTTTSGSMCLHEAALWVWGAGGELLSEDCRQVLFNQPAAMEGWRKYFSLQPFLSPETLTVPSAGDLFMAGKAAILFAGVWWGAVGRHQNPSWGPRLGVALPPGTPFAGGSSFVIWKYSPYGQEAFELVRFLSSQPTHIPGSPHNSMLPTRREAMHMPSVERDIFHRTYLQALEKGRNFPTLRLWGLIEDRLIREIASIWKELFANPKQDLDACLHRHFDPLAKQIDDALARG